MGPHKHSLVNSLQELALVFADLGVVDLPHQLGVFVDEPCFPEYVSSRVFDLQHRKTYVIMRHQKHYDDVGMSQYTKCVFYEQYKHKTNIQAIILLLVSLL